MQFSRLPIGYFGASTGAGAALRATADPRVTVGAVVSRGGWPDLAGESLTRVRAPTLLIVGGRDEVALELNRRAQAAIPAECQIAVIPGPPTSSENQAPSKRSLCWPETGSSTT